MAQPSETEDTSQLKDCYVCLEPTVGKSPCICQSPIHTSCLLQLVNSNPEHVKCSICKHPLHGFYLSTSASNIDFTLSENGAQTIEETYVQMTSRRSDSRCLLSLLRVLVSAFAVFVITYVLTICNPTTCTELHPSSYFLIVFFVIVFSMVFCMPCERKPRVQYRMRDNNSTVTV